MYSNVFNQACVQWKGDPVRPVVAFVRRDRWCYVNEDPLRPPNLVTCRDATLDVADDGLPAEVAWSDSEYIQAEEGDTLGTIVYRLAVWMSDWHGENTNWWPADDEEAPPDPTPELIDRRIEIRKTYTEDLRRLNPKLPANDHEKLPEGTRVIIRKDNEE
ncbi:MAG: hypothetical protein FWE88_05400 [Phycisphaerae bacterium]|nr:hypothetical protein [Phycisphaerae bacterium]